MNLNAQPWSRPFTNQGRLAMLRLEGDGPGDMKWEAALSNARARTDDNLATPFGCNEPPFEFFCANGDYVLYDYRALERRASKHARVSAVLGRVPLRGVAATWSSCSSAGPAGYVRRP